MIQKLLYTIDAELFTRVPDTFREKKRTEWSTIVMGEKEIDCFLEGPSFDRNGNLYVVDISNGRIFSISPSGKWALFSDYEGNPNGLKIHKDGRVFVADCKNGIMVADQHSGNVTPLCERAFGERFKGVNDLFFDSNGDLYFTDPGNSSLSNPDGRVFCYSDSGKLECLIRNGAMPNGLLKEPFGTGILVGMTRLQEVWHISVLPDGGIGRVGVFARMPAGGTGGPDGMAVDEKGNLLVTHARSGYIWIFSKIGVLIGYIKSNRGEFVTNIAFGGEDNKELFITEASRGEILVAKMPYPGRRMFSHD